MFNSEKSLNDFFLRKEYNKTKKQLDKGGLWFTKTVACLVGKDCQRDWRHIGIICFPNIDNREFFRSNKIDSEEMLKVLYFTI